MSLDIVIGMRCDFSELLIFLAENREYLRDGGGGGGGGEAFFYERLQLFQQQLTNFRVAEIVSGAVKIYAAEEEDIFRGGGGDDVRKVLNFSDG